MALSAFGKAFAEARKAGDKTFEFNGKKYHTRTAEEDQAAKKRAPAPTQDEMSSRSFNRAPTQDEMGSRSFNRGATSSGRSSGMGSRTLSEVAQDEMSGRGLNRAPTQDEMSGRSLNRAEGMKKGGVTRADGCITKGHTRGKMV